jgi:hypothetical protein
MDAGWCVDSLTGIPKVIDRRGVAPLRGNPQPDSVVTRSLFGYLRLGAPREALSRF